MACCPTQSQGKIEVLPDSITKKNWGAVLKTLKMTTFAHPVIPSHQHFHGEKGHASAQCSNRATMVTKLNPVHTINSHCLFKAHNTIVDVPKKWGRSWHCTIFQVIFADIALLSNWKKDATKQTNHCSDISDMMLLVCCIDNIMVQFCAHCDLIIWLSTVTAFCFLEFMSASISIDSLIKLTPPVICRTAAWALLIGLDSLFWNDKFQRQLGHN